MTMKRLSVLDAGFLHLEDASSPMHIGGVSLFEGPAPSRDEVIRLLEAKLDLLPRYRQRVRVPPLELGRPVWVDDERFEPRRHLRHAVLPAPAGAAALDALVGRIMSPVLPRDRPLWELWIVEGLAEGRWALVSKVHHAMVDGVAGVDLQTTLLEAARDAPLPAARPFRPDDPPSGARLVLDAWGGLASDAGTLALGALRTLAHPLRAAGLVAGAARGLATFARKILTVRSGALQGTVDVGRTYARASVALAEVQAIRAAFGGTVNDVVLAALAGGYRALLAAHGGDPRRGPLRSLVPVSVRAPAERGHAGNRVSAILCDLPVDVADPIERVRAVHAQMERLKASHMAEAGLLVVLLGDLAPPMVLGPATRLLARAMHRVPQRAVATVTTNVPGPRQPLYLRGRRMLEWSPYVPITQGVRVGTAILSYAGRLAFGITTDSRTVPDAAVLARAVEEELASLAAAARAEETPPALKASAGRRSS
jgi:diacylglycerol O-acyltransferase